MPCETTLIPVREVFELLGYNFAWNINTGQATLTQGRTVIVITADSRQFTVHGFTRRHDHLPAQMLNGHLMAPFEQLMLNIGIHMWRDNANVLHIVSLNV